MLKIRYAIPLTLNVKDYGTALPTLDTNDEIIFLFPSLNAENKVVLIHLDTFSFEFGSNKSFIKTLNLCILDDKLLYLLTKSS